MLVNLRFLRTSNDNIKRQQHAHFLLLTKISLYYRKQKELKIKHSSTTSCGIG